MVPLYVFLALCLISLIAERMGAPTTLELRFKGDVKRETRWLAQYGQGVSTITAALFVWMMDPSRKHGALELACIVLTTSLSAMLLKKLLGRVRPRHPNAGKFLGPTLRHDNSRESFPSSHSACAMTLSVVLVAYYPQAAALFWLMAGLTALLRYVMDAHWPSDIFGGLALGYGLGHLGLSLWH